MKNKMDRKLLKHVIFLISCNSLLAAAVRNGVLLLSEDVDLTIEYSGKCKRNEIFLLDCVIFTVFFEIFPIFNPAVQQSTPLVAMLQCTLFSCNCGEP